MRLPGVRRLLRLTPTARAVEREVDDEMRFHIETRVAELTATGLDPREAHARATAEFGDVSAARAELTALGKRRYARRDRREALATLLQDVRYAVRGLSREPGYTVVSLITLALGIGATTAMFSVVNGIVLRPLPYRDADRIVRVASLKLGQIRAVSGPDFIDWRRDARSFSGLAAFTESSVSLTGSGTPQRFDQARVSSNLFELLGVRPLVGRAFAPGEDDAAAPRVAVISERLWRSRFGADQQLVGKLLTLDGFPTRIVGVAPSSMRFPSTVDFWLTTRFSARDIAPSSRGARWIGVVGRLSDGATLQTAQAEMSAIAGRIAALDSAHNNGVGVRIVELRDVMVGSLRRPLSIMLAAVSFVLLIAAANVTSLTLARTAARESELAVRAALGAGRGRLLRLILTESVCLTALGGALGVVVAVGGTRLITALAPTNIPRLYEVRVDGGVLLFCAALSLLCGAAVGVFAMSHASTRSLSIRLGARGGLGSPGSVRARSTLVVGEVALALVLLTGAGLLLRSLARLTAVDPGFRTAGTATFSVTLASPDRYATRARYREFGRTLVEQIERLPGVDHAAVTFGLPLSGAGFNLTFDVAGRPPASTADQPTAQFRMVSREYFATMGIPLRAGREFESSDRDGAPQVIVISQETARRFFPNENPIGKRLSTGWSNGDAKLGGEIVGIVGDVKLFGLAEGETPMAYAAVEQFPLDEQTVVIHGSGDPTRTLAAAIGVVRALDPNLPVYDAGPLERLLSDSLGQRRFYMTLLGAFAAVAIVLAGVGIYGLVAYGVTRRTREIGVRLALGARPSKVVAMLMGQSFRLAAAGIVLGTAGALSLTRLMRGLLYETTPSDPVTFGLVTLGVAAVALVASYVPARRAARVDPTTALRA